MNPKRALLGCSIFLATLCCLGGYGTYRWLRVDFDRAADDLPRQRSLARAEGIPTEPEDLKPAIPVPDSENAAPWIRKLGERRWKKGMVRVTELWDKLPGGDQRVNKTKLNQYLKENPNLLDVCDHAYRSKGCDFKRDWALGPNLVFREFTSIKNAARALAAVAEAKAEKGTFQDRKGRF